MNFHGQKLEKNIEIVEAMKPVAKRHGKPVSAVAIRFILDYIENSVVLAGAKRPSQIKGNVEALDWKLEEEEISMLDSVSRVYAPLEHYGGCSNTSKIARIYHLHNHCAASRERRAA